MKKLKETKFDFNMVVNLLIILMITYFFIAMLTGTKDVAEANRKTLLEIKEEVVNIREEIQK